MELVQPEQKLHGLRLLVRPNNVNYIITDSSGTRTFILPIDAIVGQIITICLAPNISINYPTIETSNSIQMWVNSISYLSYTMNSSVIRFMYIYECYELLVIIIT